MNKANELAQEIAFGQENLGKIFDRIIYMAAQDVDPTMKISALTYECFGYYNAIEHLILRFTKYLHMATPSGAFSHKETLQNFYRIIEEYEVEMGDHTRQTLLELMAFRHVGTKIYGFLIDENKLQLIISRITTEHENIRLLILRILPVLTA